MAAKRWMVLAVVAATAVLSIEMNAIAGERQIVVRDQLNVKWTQELVTYPFEAAKGECHRDSVSITGPAGPVACQLSDVTFWPGSKTFVKSAKLSFIVDLKPLARNTYTVRYGPRPATAPKSDLVVKPNRDHVEITTSGVGVKLLLGKKTYRTPEKASSVPGPIGPMRMADGPWFGGSRMYGKTGIRSYAAELTAAGPVFAEVVVRYEYADGNTVTVTAHVAAGDTSVLLDNDVKKTNGKDGWYMLIGDEDQRYVFRLQVEAYPKRGTKVAEWVSVPLATHEPGRVTQLTPWSDWVSDYTQTVIRLQLPEAKREWRITRRDSGAWVKPGPLAKFGGGGMLNRKMIQLYRGKSGELYLRLDNIEGVRKWGFGHHPPQKETRKDLTNARFRVDRHGRVGRHLNEVKDYVLEWDVKTPHPHLFMTRDQMKQAWKRKVDPKKVEELLEQSDRSRDIGSSHCMSAGLGAWLMTGDKKVGERALVVKRTRMMMAQLGLFDTMNGGGFACSLFDAAMGSGLVSEREKKLLWAQFAYLGYRMAHSDTWSMERGYCTGNLNMSVTTYMHLGLVACTIPDHPMAKTWIKPALLMFEDMMATKVGPAGEWPESVSNYMHVSTAPLLYFAIAVTNAGLGDLVNDERMKRLLMYHAMQYTPPDPRHTEQGRGGICGFVPPIGRGPGGQANGLVGAMARATAKSDPAYSAKLQWVWMRTNQPMRIPANRFGGWQRIYMDPSLPATKPDWEMNVFPQTGVLMRHGFGTKDEWYAYLVCNKTMTVPTESGTMCMVFAKGVPISARGVTSYPDREELLLSRVLLARERGDFDYRRVHYSHEAQRKVTDAAALARQQYVAGNFTIDKPGRKIDLEDPKYVGHHYLRRLPEWPTVVKEGKPGVTWRRQVLFVRDDDPAKVNYLVLRDTVSGNQPTMWQFWCVSEKIGTPEQLANRKRFLADAPGHKIVGPSQLPQSDRYTAAGQFDVDVEFYIAEPTATPRHTLRFGIAKRDKTYPVIRDFKEFQDLLHLQRPDDGAYFVVIYPRRRHEEVPTFSTLGNGKIIKVAGTFGTDLCFLSEKPVEASAEGATFQGTAASVQDRKNGLVLSLGAKGRIGYKKHGVAGSGAVGLRIVGARALAVSFPLDHQGASATITAPGAWALAESVEGVTLTAGENGSYTVTVPKGVRTVKLVNK